jgi:hypothetical protein
MEIKGNNERNKEKKGGYRSNGAAHGAQEREFCAKCQDVKK